MYIIYVKDDLGVWYECGEYNTYDEAHKAMSEMSKDDPLHKYRIVHIRDYMYIIYVKDGLGGWYECGAYDTYDEAYKAMSEMSKDDPFHKYRIVHK